MAYCSQLVPVQVLQRRFYECRIKASVQHTLVRSARPHRQQAAAARLIALNGGGRCKGILRLRLGPALADARSPMVDYLRDHKLCFV